MRHKQHSQAVAQPVPKSPNVDRWFFTDGFQEDQEAMKTSGNSLTAASSAQTEYDLHQERDERGETMETSDDNRNESIESVEMVDTPEAMDVESSNA